MTEANGTSKFLLVTPHGQVYFGTVDMFDMRMTSYPGMEFTLGPDASLSHDEFKDQANKVMEYDVNTRSRDLRLTDDLGEAVTFLTGAQPQVEEPQAEAKEMTEEMDDTDEWEQVEI